MSQAPITSCVPKWQPAECSHIVFVRVQPTDRWSAAMQTAGYGDLFLAVRGAAAALIAWISGGYGLEGREQWGTRVPDPACWTPRQGRRAAVGDDRARRPPVPQRRPRRQVISVSIRSGRSRLLPRRRVRRGPRAAGVRSPDPQGRPRWAGRYPGVRERRRALVHPLERPSKDPIRRRAEPHSTTVP